MPPDYGNSNPLPPGYGTAGILLPDGTYTFSQQPVYVDPNYQSVSFGLLSIAQAIYRLAEVIEKQNTKPERKTKRNAPCDGK